MLRIIFIKLNELNKNKKTERTICSCIMVSKYNSRKLDNITFKKQCEVEGKSVIYY